ncbi:MAG: hypothetical protein WC521_03540 [Bdellovibrionales bacterium]
MTAHILDIPSLSPTQLADAYAFTFWRISQANPGDFGRNALPSVGCGTCTEDYRSKETAVALTINGRLGISGVLGKASDTAYIYIASGVYSDRESLSLIHFQEDVKISFLGPSRRKDIVHTSIWVENTAPQTYTLHEYISGSENTPPEKEEMTVTVELCEEIAPVARQHLTARLMKAFRVPENKK